MSLFLDPTCSRESSTAGDTYLDRTNPILDGRMMPAPRCEETGVRFYDNKPRRGTKKQGAGVEYR